MYREEAFRYDAEKDVYHCPAGQQLHAGEGKTQGEEKVTLYTNKTACRECALRDQCTWGGRRREIIRRENDEAIERAAARLEGAGAKYEQRRNSVEHVFGTRKQWGHRGHRELLLKGMEKVRGEIHLSALSYNLCRAIAILGVEGVLQGLREKQEEMQAA